MKQKKNNHMMIFLFLLYVCLSAGGLLLFKMGSKNLNILMTADYFNIKASWIMILGILCYGCSFILWLIIVSYLDLSYAMPLSVGLVNLFVLLGSWLVLHESISFMQWIGTFVIILGLLIINAGG